MLETALIVLVVLAAAIIAVLAYAATRPGLFHVQRSKVISAPADRIFPLISNLERMNTWNPFAKGDPKLKLTYSGPESGAGAAYDWDSEGRAGKGRVEITDASPPSRVVMRLIMIRPIAADNVVEFTLRPQGGTTEVTWAMTGESRPLIAKLMDALFNMNRMVGSEFEKGLTDLKAMAEG